jgi:gliding motility-associated-like protein
MITNQFGCVDTITMPDFIQVDGPVGTFSYSPTAGCIPLSVTFTSNTHNAATLMWVFGDGNIAYGDTVVYQYTQGGSYTPVLVMTDSLTGPLDSVLCTVTLTGQQPITVIDGFPGFFADTTFSCLPGTFNFTDTSTTSQVITSWTWDFGDGGVSAIQNPSHYYAAPGVYPVTLTIGVDSCDFTHTQLQYITIFDPPDILFTLSDSNGCSPLNVDFTIIDTTVTESVSSWLWDFGDGSPADTAKNPTHNYNTSGTYNINVTANFTNGCFDNYADPVNMTIVQTPTALYTTEQSNFYPLTPIAFIDTSLGPVTTWYWDLGDGTTGTTQDITHGYQYVGIYDILFIVSASGVCWDTLHSTFEVKERIDIPNAFTPDGDGINDVYMRGSNLIVLNRWGQLLYEGLDGWDGNFKGNEMPAGTYYYIITLEQIKDKIEKYQGPLTLIRKNE